MLELLKQTVAYLESNGVGSQALTLFYGQLPDTPVNCTAVLGGPGLRDEFESGLRKPTIQVLVRAETFDTAADRADDIFKLLDSKWNVLTTIKGRWMAQNTAGVNFRDTNNFPVFSLNFNLITTTANTF